MNLSGADIIEALLFAADQPLSSEKLALAAELEIERAREELAILQEEKARIGALQLVEIAEGWQLVTKPQFAPHIRRLREVPRQKVSRAAFEVLAIVAYRQPVTRALVEEIRGVDCAGPLQWLLEKKLLAFAGRKDAPGRPWLYATTPLFLENFGLRAVDDLPSLEEWNALHQEARASNLFGRGAMTAPDHNSYQEASENAVQVLAEDETE